MADEAIRRGDLFWVDWSPGRSSDQLGTRPALVIQNDGGNADAHYPNTVAVTRSTKGHSIPSHVEIGPSVGNGSRETSFVKCEQVQTVSKQRLSGTNRRLEGSDLVLVAAALRVTLVL